MEHNCIRESSQVKNKEGRIRDHGSNIVCLVTAAFVVSNVITNVIGNVVSNVVSSVAGWVTKLRNGLVRIGGIGGEIDTGQFRKHSVKGLSLFHFVLVTDDLQNGRGGQHEIGGARGILSEIVIRRNAIGGVESVVGRGGKDGLKTFAGSQTTLQSVRNVRIPDKLREAPVVEPLGSQLRFVNVMGDTQRRIGEVETANRKLPPTVGTQHCNYFVCRLSHCVKLTLCEPCGMLRCVQSWMTSSRQPQEEGVFVFNHKRSVTD
jgi:hypothetical protein